MPMYVQRPYYYFILTHDFFLFKDVIRKLQDILDRKPPAILDVPENSSVDDTSEEDEYDIPTCENINYSIVSIS